MSDEDTNDLNPVSNESLLAAIDDRDTARIHAEFMKREFILINVPDDDDEDEDENIGALTAAIDDFHVLVAFTSDEAAQTFIDTEAELFADEDDVQGFLVQGDALLEYLPDDFGLLLDAECEVSFVVDPSLVSKVKAELDA